MGRTEILRFIANTDSLRSVLKICWLTLTLIGCDRLCFRGLRLFVGLLYEAKNFFFAVLLEGVVSRFLNLLLSQLCFLDFSLYISDHCSGLHVDIFYCAVYRVEDAQRALVFLQLCQQSR